MQLYIKDRLYIMQILPAQNTLLDFKLKKDLLKKIGLSEQDEKEYNITLEKENGRVVWDVEKDKANPIEVEFTDSETKYLLSACEQVADNVFPDEVWETIDRLYESIQH